MKLITPKEDRRIPLGYAIRVFVGDEPAPEIRDDGCLWLARHAGLEPSCDWHSWERSYARAVMATRTHRVLCRRPTRPRGR